MDYHALEELYYQGEFETLFEKAQHYLDQNPSDTEILYLMATAHYDRIYPDGPLQVYKVLKRYTIPYLQQVLEINPLHSKALFEILALPTSNQMDLKRHGKPKLHITQDNLAEFLGYAERLMTFDYYAEHAYDFVLAIYQGLENVEFQLAWLDKAMAYNRSYYKDSRDSRDHNNSKYFIKKIDLLYNYDNYDKKLLIPLIEQILPNFSSPIIHHYFILAKIAYSHNAYDLATQAILQGLDSNLPLNDAWEDLNQWHQMITDLVVKGNLSETALLVVLILERHYHEELGLESDTFYHTSLQFMKSAPDLYVSFHFAGNYFLDNKDFEKAYAHYKRALEIKPTAITFFCFIQSCIYTQRPLDIEIGVFQDHPMEIYNAATSMDRLIIYMEFSNYLYQLKSLRANLYQQAHQSFLRYFQQDHYFSRYDCTAHAMAMNCNNYAIALIAVQVYTTAIEIAEMGLSKSNFWQLHTTYIDALFKAEQYLKAKNAIGTFLANHTLEFAPEGQSQLQESNLILAEFYLDTDPDLVLKAKKQLEKLYNFYQDQPQYSDYYIQDIEVAKSNLEHVIYQCFEEDTDLFKKEYYQRLSKAYPKESHPYFILMQIHNDTEDYIACAKAASKYLKYINPDFSDDQDEVKAVYLLYKSYLSTQEYEKTIPLYQNYFSWVNSILEDGSLHSWLMIVLQANVALNNLEIVLEIKDQIDQLYQQQQWHYDKELESVYLQVAESLYNNKELQAAHQLLNQVLNYEDAHAKAHHFKATWKKKGFLPKFNW